MTHNIMLEDTFRGPLDLLLHLVKRDEIDIHDIPIAHLTREFLAEMNQMVELDIEPALEFMTMASMLVEIKSRMLLPPAETLAEDEEEIFDPRAGLVQALLEYKRFKEAAAELDQMSAAHSLRFARLAPAPTLGIDEEETVESAQAPDLLAAFQKMINSMLTTEAREIIYDDIPIDVRMQQIMEVVRAVSHTTFSRLLSSAPTKGEMVGFFIALMELIRLRRVRARQAADLTDIHIERIKVKENLGPQGSKSYGFRRAPLATFLPLRRWADGLGGRGTERLSRKAAVGGSQNGASPFAPLNPGAPSSPAEVIGAFLPVRPVRPVRSRPAAPLPAPAASFFAVRVRKANLGSARAETALLRRPSAFRGFRPVPLTAAAGGPPLRPGLKL